MPRALRKELTLVGSFVGFLVVFSAISGCVSTGDIAPEAATLDANALATDHATQAAAREAGWPQAQWWKVYADPQLDAWIEKALDGNPGLAVAHARVRQAKSMAGLVESIESPQIEGKGSLVRHRWPDDYFYGPGDLARTTSWNNSTEIGLNYKLDLWGRDRSDSERAVDLAHMAAAEARQAQLELEGNIVRAYVQLSLQYAEMDIAKAMLQQQRDILALAQRRLRGGIGTHFEVSQAEVPLPETERRIEVIDEEIQLTRNLLAALAGKGPGEGRTIRRPSLNLAAQPSLPSALPAELLGRQPDPGGCAEEHFRPVDPPAFGGHPEGLRRAIGGFRAEDLRYRHPGLPARPHRLPQRAQRADPAVPAATGPGAGAGRPAGRPRQPAHRPRRRRRGRRRYAGAAEAGAGERPGQSGVFAMSGRSAGFALPSRDEWRRALAEWARSDGATWIYVFKVLCAAFLTLWLAMRLELPQPSTATITVFIVMQPQSGQVFAKSFYRILGTLVGLSVMVTLIALFAQERVLFLLSSAIWIGLCTAGAARYRDFRSYACVLAGYTATLIGIPATSHPEGAFMQAIWRVLEISLAILCSGVVSAVIMPQTTSAAMRNALYVRFGLFAAFVLDSLRGVGGRERFESSNVAFAAQAVGLETMRAASAFEDPHMRLRNGRLIRLSSEFMAMNTRFHALHQLLERLRAQGSTQVLEAFEPCLEEITGLLEEIRGRAVTDHDAERFAQRLADCRERLMARIRQARGELLAREPGEEARLDFNTAAELLYRFAEEMHDYALTHASLAAHRHEREQWKDAFTAKANAVAAAVAGMRTGLMILLFGCFWIYSTWPSGGTFALNAVAVSALASAAPNPKKVAMQMAIGTMAAALLGFSEMFFVYPHIDGFPLLCLVLAPVFALGAFISSRPQWAGYGLGLLVFFCFGSVPANLTVYDPAHVINEYIALILSMLLSAAAAAVILPPNSAWLWKRLERDLRMRVVFAISGRSRGLGSAFESGTRDLLNQAYGVAAGRPDVQRGLLRWMFLVLEVGHAIIELRREQERLPDEPCYAEAMPWRQAIRAMGRALIRLFVRPGAENLERALAAVDQAIHAARHTDEPCAPHFDSSPLRRVRSYLHFIRSSLLAPTSPLTELAGRTSGQGTVHAS